MHLWHARCTCGSENFNCKATCTFPSYHFPLSIFIPLSLSLFISHSLSFLIFFPFFFNFSFSFLRKYLFLSLYISFFFQLFCFSFNFVFLYFPSFNFLDIFLLLSLSDLKTLFFKAFFLYITKGELLITNKENLDT